MDDRNRQLERRMITFAAGTIKLLQDSPGIPRSVNDQLTRSASSIGANYAEACNASSKLDFRNKIFVAKKEAGESRYWLDLVMELVSNPKQWEPYRQEAHELLVILQTIVNTLKTASVPTSVK
jgi:four helix bundle protein